MSRNNNIYLYNPNENNLCCQCWENVPPTSPDWLVKEHAKNINNNTVYKPLDVQCTEWQFEGIKMIFIITNVQQQKKKKIKSNTLLLGK